MSRYYDPETGRFISPDAIEYLDPSTIGGLNLYAYCYNNPINYYDPTGHIPILITLVLVGFTILGMAVGGAVAYSQNKSGWEAVKYVVLGGALGLALGGLIIALIGTFGVVFGNAGANTLILGIEAKKIAAIGLLAYNLPAAVIMPIFGINMELIEGGGTSYQPTELGKAPKHPAEKRASLSVKNIMNNEIMQKLYT